MIITAKNIDMILDRPRHIVIPKASIAATFLLHTLILNTACVLLYGTWAYVGIPLFLAEILIHLTLLRKIWLRVGYSQKIFAAGMIINIILNAFIAIPERRLISDAINAVFMR